MNIWKQKLLDVKRERFINESSIKHNNVYDYHKFIYKNSSTKGCIICALHGEFFQTPLTHLKTAIPCPHCDSKRRVGIYKRIRLPKHTVEFHHKTIDGVTWWIKECPYCHEEMRYRRRTKLKNSMKRGLVCTNCSFHKITKSGHRYRPYIFSDGRVEMVQGYEPLTLNYLISQSIDASTIKIKHSEKPVVSYQYNGVKKYYPDAFISNTQTIVETKSTWTWNNAIDQNKAKIKGTTESGYNMRVIIWNGSQKLVSDTFYESLNGFKAS